MLRQPPATKEDALLSEIATLKSDLNRAIARQKRADLVIGDLVPRLGLPETLSAHVKGLDPIDALDLVSKRAGTFRPSTEIAPESKIGDQEKLLRAISPRSYM